MPSATRGCACVGAAEAERPASPAPQVAAAPPAITIEWRAPHATALAAYPGWRRCAGAPRPRGRGPAALRHRSPSYTSVALAPTQRGRDHRPPPPPPPSSVARSSAAQAPAAAGQGAGPIVAGALQKRAAGLEQEQRLSSTSGSPRSCAAARAAGGAAARRAADRAGQPPRRGRRRQRDAEQCVRVCGVGVGVGVGVGGGRGERSDGVGDWERTESRSRSGVRCRRRLTPRALSCRRCRGRRRAARAHRRPAAHGLLQVVSRASMRSAARRCSARSDPARIFRAATATPRASALPAPLQRLEVAKAAQARRGVAARGDAYSVRRLRFPLMSSLAVPTTRA